MFDRQTARIILLQSDEAIEKILTRSAKIDSASYFTDSPEGIEKLDGICMLFMAIGESLKNVDKITNGELFAKYPAIDWTGIKGFRDIIAHQYFNIDAEQVFWIICHELKPLSNAIKKMIKELS
ncbi:MAG: DUF86 domain-containing protein [Pseudomonadota bacterium]